MIGTLIIIPICGVSVMNPACRSAGILQALFFPKASPGKLATVRLRGVVIDFASTQLDLDEIIEPLFDFGGMQVHRFI
ncbi:hypothetical protein [Azotobacter armeniacus]